jgi:hypothetical protein
LSFHPYQPTISSISTINPHNLNRKYLPPKIPQAKPQNPGIEPSLPLIMSLTVDEFQDLVLAPWTTMYSPTFISSLQYNNTNPTFRWNSIGTKFPKFDPIDNLFDQINSPKNNSKKKDQNNDEFFLYKSIPLYYNPILNPDGLNEFPQHHHDPYNNDKSHRTPHKTNTKNHPNTPKHPFFKRKKNYTSPETISHKIPSNFIGYLTLFTDTIDVWISRILLPEYIVYYVTKVLDISLPHAPPLSTHLSDFPLNPSSSQPNSKSDSHQTSPKTSTPALPSPLITGITDLKYQYFSFTKLDPKRDKFPQNNTEWSQLPILRSIFTLFDINGPIEMLKYGNAFIDRDLGGNSGKSQGVGSYDGVGESQIAQISDQLQHNSSIDKNDIHGVMWSVGVLPLGQGQENGDKNDTSPQISLQNGNNPLYFQCNISISDTERSWSFIASPFIDSEFILRPYNQNEINSLKNANIKKEENYLNSKNPPLSTPSQNHQNHHTSPSSHIKYINIDENHPILKYLSSSQRMQFLSQLSLQKSLQASSNPAHSASSSVLPAQTIIFSLTTPFLLSKLLIVPSLTSSYTTNSINSHLLHLGSPTTILSHISNSQSNTSNTGSHYNSSPHTLLNSNNSPSNNSNTNYNRSSVCNGIRSSDFVGYSSYGDRGGIRDGDRITNDEIRGLLNCMEDVILPIAYPALFQYPKLDLHQKFEIFNVERVNNIPGKLPRNDNFPPTAHPTNILPLKSTPVLMVQPNHHNITPAGDGLVGGNYGMDDVRGLNESKHSQKTNQTSPYGSILPPSSSLNSQQITTPPALPNTTIIDKLYQLKEFKSKFPYYSHNLPNFFPIGHFLDTILIFFGNNDFFIRQLQLTLSKHDHDLDEKRKRDDEIRLKEEQEKLRVEQQRQREDRERHLKIDKNAKLAEKNNSEKNPYAIPRTPSESRATGEYYNLTNRFAKKKKVDEDPGLVDDPFADKSDLFDGDYGLFDDSSNPILDNANIEHVPKRKRFTLESDDSDGWQSRYSENNQLKTQHKNDHTPYKRSKPNDCDTSDIGATSSKSLTTTTIATTTTITATAPHDPISKPLILPPAPPGYNKRQLPPLPPALGGQQTTPNVVFFGVKALPPPATAAGNQTSSNHPTSGGITMVRQKRR